jgi:hypothetical protein
VCGSTLALATPALAMHGPTSPRHGPGGGSPHPGKGGASKATIATAPNVVTFGSSTAITGHATGKHGPGEMVQLEGRPAPYTSSFKVIATTTADQSGHYVFRVAPWLNTDYHVVANVAPPATSPDMFVKVRVRVTARVSTSTPVIGHAVRFSGYVLWAYNRRYVQIQRRTATGWKTVGRARLVAATPSGAIARSKYSQRLKVRSSGTYRVRFNPADGMRLANSSPTRTLTVRH